MLLNVSAKTNIPDVVIDFIGVQLRSGQEVFLNWDLSEISRNEDGFEATYRGVCFNYASANGRLSELEGLKISDIGLYFESAGTFHFQINEMVFEEYGRSFSFQDPEIPIDCSGLACLTQNVAPSLAERLVDFCKDFDFYNFKDCLEVGQAETEAIHQMEEELKSPNTLASLVTQLKAISADEDITPDQRKEVNSLIEALSEMSQHSQVKPSLQDQIRSAQNRSVVSRDATDLKAKLPER